MASILVMLRLSFKSKVTKIQNLPNGFYIFLALILTFSHKFKQKRITASKVSLLCINSIRFAVTSKLY